MIAHPILSLLIPSSPGPDICHNLSTHTHTQHLCDARWWSHTYPKVYLRTRTHKSRFIGDNPMTANLLEGYTFFFISFFIYPLLLRLQGNLLGGQLEEASINLDFHYHAPSLPPQQPLSLLLPPSPCIPLPAHPFKIKPPP